MSGIVLSNQKDHEKEAGTFAVIVTGLVMTMGLLFMAF